MQISFLLPRMLPCPSLHLTSCYFSLGSVKKCDLLHLYITYYLPLFLSFLELQEKKKYPKWGSLNSRN